MSKRTGDPVSTYARAVIAGEIVTGRPVRLACERHLRDLETGTARGLHFDPAKADRAIGFFHEHLQLTDGKFDGLPFYLQPFQQFIVGCLFGWRQKDGRRRFRKAYVECAKGNGKSPLAGGIGLYMLLADGEAAAEVYAAATTREQASILWRDAARMVEASPSLRELLHNGASSIADERTNSVFRAISTERRGLDGKRVHCALIDELHEHPDSIVVDKVQANTKGRAQPLIFEITNSGYDRHSVCRQHHEYSLKVLDGIFEDDSWFAYVCQLDEGDDWRTDEACWVKANPNIDVSLPREYLREQVREAKGMPAKESIVARLNFCVWTEQSQRWLDMRVWDACGESFDVEALRGRACIGGLDLARVLDLSAFVLLFPPVEDAEPWKLLSWYWVPEENIGERVRRDRVPYDVWVRQGLLRATEGNTTDFDWIKADILELAKLYDIRDIGYDRTFAGELVNALVDEGLKLTEFGQGFLSMAAPTAELQRLLLSKQIAHGGHPILRWMASNVSVAQDPAGNLKPDKQRSGEKIDGIVATVMALGRAMHPENANSAGASVYETRGLLVFG